MTEATLTRRIIAWLKSQGCYVVKRHGSVYAQRGEPDLYVLVQVPYQIFAVPLHLEVKQPGREPTALQQKRLMALRAAGASATWVTSLEEVQELVEELYLGP
jgi:hypothetical protein